MVKDWLFTGDTYICDLRAAGVLIKNGCVLMQRDAGGTEYALPGGHVHIGEDTEHALVREWQEEMGISVSCEKLLWTEECFWRWQDRQAHNLCFYYLIEAKDTAALPKSGVFIPHRDNPRVEVGWLAIDQLERTTVYPAFIKEKIHHLDQAPSHHITYA